MGKTFINISLMKSWWLKLCNIFFVFWWISIILWQKCKQMDLMMSHYLNKHRSDQSLFSSWLCKRRGYWSVYSVNCQLISYPLLFFLKQKWLITNVAIMRKSVDFVCFPKGKEIGPLYDLVVRIYSDMICIKVAGNCVAGEKGRSIFKGLGKPNSFIY